MIKVLGLALYGPLAASTRYRLCQYVPGLAKMGIDLQVRSLLDDDYLRARFSGDVLPISTMLKDSFLRLGDLWNQNEYDAVILYCELIPLMPAWLERALIRKPYIYDFDDAFYLKYRSGRLSFASSVTGTKFDKLIAGAVAVTAGNRVLSNYASLYNNNTVYLPTVVDTDRYLPKPPNHLGQAFTIGWIGSPSTAHYLSELVAPLSAIGQDGLVRFIVIGGKAPFIPNVTVVEIDWDESTELALISSFDVGVMPLSDDEWARGKCAFKIIQYMACSVAVVASPVGANIDLVNLNCGILAYTSTQWTDAFRFLRDDPKVRTNMGKEGRKKVVKDFSLHQNLPIFADVIMNARG